MRQLLLAVITDIRICRCVFVYFMKIEFHENSLSCFAINAVCAHSRKLTLYVNKTKTETILYVHNKHS
jgi:hypothetical protein